VYGEPVKEPAMYTTARASGNIDKSKLNETEAARRVPLSVPNSFSDSFNSGIILLFMDSPRDYYNTSPIIYITELSGKNERLPASIII
jgi:hypothetical protein